MREEESGTPPLVVIAEDEEPIAEALAFIVEDRGYAAKVATHGKQALELIQEYHPALILTDLMMPQMTGAELIATVREQAARDHVAPPPMVLMSAAGKQFTAQAGADAVLPKPFDLAEVETLLERFLAPAVGHPHP